MLPLVVLLVATAGSSTEIPASQPAFQRQSVGPSEKTRALLSWGRRIGAKGSHIVTPTALDAFFQGLDSLARGTAEDSVEIVTFGNSLISGDNVTNIVRKRLQERFGDGGRGHVLADRMADWGDRSRTGYTDSSTWNPFNLAMGPKGRNHFGFGGIYHESNQPTRTEWKLSGEQKGELFWFDHKDAPAMELRADGQSIAMILPERTGKSKSLKFHLEAGTKRLYLVAKAARAVVHGVSLENDKPGVILDTVGIPAAEASTYLGANQETLAAHLQALRPKLIMIMLGGNEIRRLAWAPARHAEARKTQLRENLATMIDRAMPSAPGASCLVVGPIDAVYGPNAPSEELKLRSRPQTPELVAIEREVAASKGCAFFDLHDAMGGKGSLERFNAQGWINEDLVHPRGKGLDILGEMLAQGILDAYVGAPASPAELARAQ